ncbi:TonB-dependent receptor plug domain-containing protein [Muricoccus vinaceus]|uniref:TonB-dependent receptor plug domain-containing protein n=1 Tax=Muricoccus vinaceus TaxID=424704 RepID=A0ABV6IZ34_9PROT
MLRFAAHRADLPLVPAFITIVSAFLLGLPTQSVCAQSVSPASLEALFGEPVTTSATGKPQRASEVPVPMEIISAEQIRRSGAHDIPTILARYTSLDVQQYNAHDFSVGVRAFTTPMGQRLQVLVNGRQVYLDHYGYAAWDSIPVQIAEIRQIEVVKGPNSALFGFNAASGVINIITYDPIHDQRSVAEVRVGSGGYREVSAVATAPLGSAGGVRISAGSRGERPWARGYTDFEVQELDGRRSPTRNQVAAEAAFNLSPGVRLSFDASYSRAIAGNFQDYGQVWREDKRVWSLRSRLTADTDLGIFDAQIYHNGLTNTYAATSYPLDSGLTVADLGHAFKINPAHTLRPVLQLRHATMQPLPGAQVSYDVVGTGVMWDWALKDNLTLTSSLRYDHLRLGAKGYDDPAFPFGNQSYDRAFGQLSWNIGAVWRASDLDTVRASAARGVSLPSLSDYGWRDSYPSFGYQDTGTPTIAPTVVYSYELEYRRKAAIINGNVGLNTFLQSYRGFTSGLSTVTFVPPDVALNTYTPVNLGKARVAGFEASADGVLPGRFIWGLRYRLSAVSSDFRPSQQDPKRVSPRHLATLRLGWSDDRWEVDVFGRYSSSIWGYRALNEEDVAYVEVKNYAALAARLGYKLTERMTLSIEGENLLHGRQRQNLAIEAERRVYVSLRSEF